MSDAVIDKLSTVDVATLVALILLITFVVNLVTPWFTKLSKYIIAKYKKEESEKTLAEKVKQHDEKLKDHERVFTSEHSDLVNSVNALKATMEKHIQMDEKRQQENLTRQNKRLRAELKDKISNRYRLHNRVGKWTSMDKETLEDLIAEYEDCGGENSFVHTVVQKKMYTWEIVDDGEDHL